MGILSNLSINCKVSIYKTVVRSSAKRQQQQCSNTDNADGEPMITYAHFEIEQEVPVLKKK